MGYSARDPAGHQRAARAREIGFTDLPLHPQIGSRAREVQAMLARRSRHRAAGVVDLRTAAISARPRSPHGRDRLTAAIAAQYAATVLHHDTDFDHIAAVTGQQVRWVVPRGSAG